MATKVRKVSYCYVTVPSRAGQATRVLGELRREGVNLLAYAGFPSRGRAQIDLVAENLAPIRKVADEKINVTAADAVAAGKGRFGMLLWVKPKDYVRAAKTLKAR
jgi:hypothetical protein